jgi:hypothetical protein
MIPQDAIQNRLSIIFAKVHHPLFYDKLMRKLAQTFRCSAIRTLQLHYVSEWHRGVFVR